jgi:starch synthase
MHIVFAASEGVPFSKTGGLADVVGALPPALVQLGHTVTVFLPRHKQTKLESPRTLLRSVTIPFDDQYRFCSVLDGGKLNGVQFYFIEYPPFFERDGLYGVPSGDYPDNAERFSLYSRAVLESVKVLGTPDLFHCHDWQSALIPVLLHSNYIADPAFFRVPVVFTIHNIGYQGLFDPDVLPLLGLPWELFTLNRLEFYGKTNFLKGGIVFSDYVTTVSRRYSQEIQTAEYGFGLEGVLRARSATVTGILNGVDYSEWDPAIDKRIAKNFTANDLFGKRECKFDLLQQFGLADIKMDVPVLGIVSRFASQKGFDLIADIADRLLREDVVLTVLGSGDKQYEEIFRRLEQQYPRKVGLRVAYDNALAHKIEAGADIFLMPSRYEPCGLNQIYSLKYGTVPVVRATGGLDDTIEQWNPKTAVGTGFKFHDYNGPALLAAIHQALAVYRDKEAWTKLMRNGMARDHSWEQSAQEYVKVYEKARQLKQ